MAIAKRLRERSKIRINLDARKRVSLVKFLSDPKIHSVIAYQEGNKIILEPMVEIPAYEAWIYEDPKIIGNIREGLKQAKEGKVRSLGSFAQYADI